MSPMPLTDNPELLTVDELATRLRIGRSTAYQLCREAGFPAVRVRGQIRVMAAELADWLKSRSGWSAKLRRVRAGR